MALGSPSVKVHGDVRSDVEVQRGKRGCRNDVIDGPGVETQRRQVSGGRKHPSVIRIRVVERS
jgi:hypothetical protein